MEEIESHIKEEAEKLLSLLGLEGSCQIHKEEDYYYLETDSPDAALLIGRHGANLESLELILNLIVAKKTGSFQKITVDVGGFRKKREEQLIDLAQKLAQKVKESGKSEVIFDLSPRERRIIHLALSENEEIETRSEGEGEDRKLIVRLKKQV